ncbi:MAG: TCP-1/cpn60 chaperonin family protein [archaeon]|nr:TCP-1/cpn60 chaperonin family protein [archaeon]MCR4323590.1 TCP-1/cpn60 chaperonin family protein [Nanoarchaeota archaeon]
MVENITSNEGSRILGRDAQRNNILAARVVAETVKTTLGPKGMDKMLVDKVGNIIITNDGVTILKEMDIEHPAAKMIVDIAKTQDLEVGDGTTTAVMLAGKFLENAEKLLDQGIHPTIITRGYRWAEEKAQIILKELSVEIDSEEELMKIAQTAMTGKGAEYLREKFSEIIVEAVKMVSEKGKVDLEDIRIEKQKGKSLEDTELIKGIVLDNERVNLEMPKRVENAKIALVEEALEIKGLETETRLSISTPEQLQSFMNQEDSLLKSKVEKIKNSGANVLIVQKGIDELVQFYLARAGIYVVRRVSKKDMQSLSKATGARVVSKLTELREEDLGFAAYVEERKEGGEGMTYIMGCKNPKALTILIRGGTDHVIDEVERAIRDALGDVASTMEDSKVVAGGGAVEIELCKRLKEFANTLRGRERLAVEEFASAMEFIPRTLAENAGMDPIDVLTELRASHDANNRNAGLNLFTGKIEDTMMKGIIEPLKVKTQAIASASEVAIMILRIDDVIAARKSQGRPGTLSNMSGYD